MNNSKIKTLFEKIDNSRYALPFFHKDKPFHIVLILTHRCRFRCVFCDHWKNRIPETLSTKIIIRLLNNAKNWLGDNFEVVLLGGDIFLRKDVFDIIDYIKLKNISSTIFTDASSLTENKIKQLSRTNQIKRYLVSLPSLSEKKFKNLRNPHKKGEFKKVLDNILLLKKYNPDKRIIIALLLHKQNLNSIKKVHDFCKTNKLELLFQPLREKISSEKRNQTIYDDFLNPELKLKGKNLISLKKQDNIIQNPSTQLASLEDYYISPETFYKKRKCNLYRSRMVVHPDCSVNLCHKSNKVGDVSFSSIKQIWYSRDAEKEKKRLRKCREYCRVSNMEYNLTPLEFVRESFSYLKNTFFKPPL